MLSFSKFGRIVLVGVLTISILIGYLMMHMYVPYKSSKKEYSEDGTARNEGTTARITNLADFYLKASKSTINNANGTQPPIYLLLRGPAERVPIEKMLFNSVDAIHSKNFIKPANESCEKRLPTCIIIGVRKCGTRELIDFMHLHPHIQIYSKFYYEMDYFAGQKMKGLEWLKNQMPCSYSNQITVMKHALYFHRDEVPERIKNNINNKGIKLVLLVREPIARLVSDLTFNKKNLQVSSSQLFHKNNTLKTYREEMTLSVYDKSMEHWLKYFNLSQFLVIESSELKYNPVSVLRKVEDFLGLDHYITEDMFVLNKEKGFFCISSNLTSTGMACYTGNRGRSQANLQKETILMLKEYFQPRNERFFELIGKSFDW